MPAHPIALRVGQKGRLHAVLASHDSEVSARAKQAGVPMQEDYSARHEYHKAHVQRPEQFGRYDPISSSLAFTGNDGSEHTVKVGDNGRLRTVLESGYVNTTEARSIGLPVPESYKGRAKQMLDPGWFNPLTHEYNMDSSPRDHSKASGRRTAHPHMGTSLTPRLNPLTQKLDPINSTRASLRIYDNRVMHPLDVHIVQRSPITGASTPIGVGTHYAEASLRPNMLMRSPRSQVPSPRMHSLLG